MICPCLLLQFLVCVNLLQVISGCFLTDGWIDIKAACDDPQGSVLTSPSFVYLQHLHFHFMRTLVA